MDNFPIERPSGDCGFIVNYNSEITVSDIVLGDFDNGFISVSLIPEKGFIYISASNDYNTISWKKFNYNNDNTIKAIESSNGEFIVPEDLKSSYEW
jgi:hypothetical protein